MRTSSRRLLRSVVGFVAATAGGCGVSVVGVGAEALPVGGDRDAALDGAGTLDAGDVGAPDREDGGAAPDGGDGSTCIPITGAAGVLVVPRVATPPKIDGDLADWPTCFVRLDAANAGQVRILEGAGGVFPAGEFTLLHDGARLYIGARMAGAPPLGDNGGPELYENDSISVYVDADGSLVNGYGADALQIVVDHAGRMQGFRHPQMVDVVNAEKAARLAGDGKAYTVELAVAPATFGAASFGPNVGFDIAWNDGTGTNQLSELVWFKKCGASSSCGCENGDDAPYCDSRQFGVAKLLP